MKKYLSLIACASAIFINANAGAPACLAKHTRYVSSSVVEGTITVQGDGTTHMQVSNAPSFFGVDVLSQYFVTYTNGSTTQLANQWDINVHTRHGINADIPTCDTNIKSVTLKCWCSSKAQ